MKQTKVRDYEKHPIPSPSASYGARIDQLACLRQAERGRQVYKLYGLTPDEIKIVKNSKI